MHFSALTVLACALVAVTARTVDNVTTVVAPVDVKNVENKNTHAVGNNILNHPKRGGHDKVASVFAPVKAGNTLNGNKVAALNNVARDVVNVKAPITLSNILNCNNISIANDILNHLAAELGCTLAQLGINAQDLVDANPQNAPALMAKLSAAVQKVQGKRDAVNAWAPITATDILNANDVEIANHILTDVAAHLGCTVAEVGVLVEDILHATAETIGAILSKLNRHAKRDAVAVYAPVTITDILNCNTIKIANDLLNHLAALLKCTLAELGVKAEELVGAKGAKADALLATLKAAIAKVQAQHKRGVADVKAPVGVSNVANYNVVDILNNVGDKRDDSLVNAAIPITATDILNGNKVGVLNNVASPEGHKRGDVISAFVPATITNIANGNELNTLNDIL